MGASSPASGCDCGKIAAHCLTEWKQSAPERRIFCENPRVAPLGLRFRHSAAFFEKCHIRCPSLPHCACILLARPKRQTLEQQETRHEKRSPLAEIRNRRHRGDPSRDALDARPASPPRGAQAPRRQTRAGPGSGRALIRPDPKAPDFARPPRAGVAFCIGPAGLRRDSRCHRPNSDAIAPSRRNNGG